MISTRKLKVTCKDPEFYKYIRIEQREQNKALNMAIGYIHTSNILKSNDSGAEARIVKGIAKLQSKIDKLNKDLANPKITEKKKEQTLKAIATNEKLIQGERKVLEEGKQFRQGLDKQFTEIYIDHHNLAQVLMQQTAMQYAMTADMVVIKVKQDYSNNFADIVTGKISLMNYKQDNPLMITGQCLKVFKDEDKYFIKIMAGFELEVVLGSRRNENKEELIITLERCISGEYKVCQSQIQFDNNNNVIFNLVIDIPTKTKYTPVPGRVLGVDLGIKYPAYMAINDSPNIKQSLGSIDDFMRVREQMQARKRKLQQALTLTKGGKGRKKKTQALDRFRDKERNWVKTYNHQLSAKIVQFAKKNKCEFINMEKLTKDGFGNKLLRNWSYYELQQMVEYKAKKEGIEVRYIDPAYTSQTCCICGNIDKDNRQTQEQFKCTKCGHEMNADHNAAINIARSKNFIK